jgi:hypothetical protein
MVRLCVLTTPIFAGRPDPTAVRQKIGDCFIMAPAASIAAFAPECLTHALSEGAGGSIVFRYQTQNGEVMRRVPRRVALSADGEPAAAYSTRPGEAWPTLLERALTSTGEGETDAEIWASYERLMRGGDPAWVMAALTGLPTKKKELGSFGDATELGAALLRFGTERRPMVLLVKGHEHGVGIIGVKQTPSGVRIRTVDTSGALNPEHVKVYSPTELLQQFSHVAVTGDPPARPAPNLTGDQFIADVGPREPLLGG